MLDLDVIIVAYNAGDLLLKAVESVLPDVAEEHVVLCDTGTTDDSIDRVAAAHPGIRVIGVGPRGFSAGNNAGIAATSLPHVLLLNPDAEARPGALAALLACAESDSRIGIVGATVVNEDGSTQANSYGRFPTLVNLVGLRLWRMGQRLAGNRRLSPRRFERRTDVDWVTGACMLVSRQAIEDAGAMDEGFFLYYEDVEWCHRMRDHGWRVVIEPSAEVVHHLGRSGGSSEAAARAYRDSFYRYARLYGLHGMLFLGRLGSGLRRLLGGRP